MAQDSWLLFLPQAPATSSSLRVQIWRHLRAAGAISLQNGVWVLPQTETHARLLHQEGAEIVRQGGTALLFVASPVALDLVARFREERDREYVEVIDRCQALLDELARETARANFTFAELEENEQEWHKLVAWLAKVQTRDFFGAPHAAEATALLARGQEALHTFTQTVYTQEGVQAAPDISAALAPEEDQP